MSRLSALFGRLSGSHETETTDERTPRMRAVAEHIRENPRTIDCRDGRALGYADCGDPDGDPLVVFHGFPHSRVFGALFDETGRENGIRIIAPERPGLGVSDPSPGRTVADWADDVTALADALSLDSFPVLGISGGGHYAAACAARLSRVERAGIACGLAPLESVDFRDRLPFLVATHARPLATLSLWADGRSARRNPEEYLESRAEMAADVDEERWRGEIGWTLLKSSLEATSRHGYGPLAEELAVSARDWGFDLDAIEIPVFCWYGKEDHTVPLSMGIHYAERIPTAEAHFYPSQGHLSAFAENEQAIFDALTDG